MIFYLALLILPALITGILLRHYGKKEDNKTKRTLGLILIILGVLIALLCAAIIIVLALFGNSVQPQP